MTTAPASLFALPERLAAKADPALISADEQHLAAIDATIHAQVADLEARYAAALKREVDGGQDMVERDFEVRQLSSTLSVLRRFGVDLCLGWMASADSAERVYIGRLGLTDEHGRRLLVDWRTPAAEPFFGATPANPMGLASRRRFRFTGGRVTDYWDESLTDAVLDDGGSAFVESLGASRSSRMRDVLGTIASDQDAIIRADGRGPLVVDGGPGTGKTVVALHRTAYLMYSDAKLRGRGRGVLFVGPHEPYLAYIDDVLPSLGEEGVRTCTLRDLVAEGRDAREEADPRTAAIKDSVDMVRVIEPLMQLIERAPRRAMSVETDWLDVPVYPQDWAEAFDSAELGAAHNEARDQVFETLLDIITQRVPANAAPRQMLRRAIRQDHDFLEVFNAAWPIVAAESLLSQLWTDERLLERATRDFLSDGQRSLLIRERGDAWTTSDLPLLDALRMRLGDPRSGEIARERAITLAADREQMDRTVEYLLSTYELDDGEGLLPMLRGSDLRATLVDEDAAPQLEVDPLAGPFTHIVVDEAQELTDAQWQMLLRRCPSRSFTIVGDRAQARHGFTQSWSERLEAVGVRRVEERPLTVSYRSTIEVMEAAEPEIRAALPDANVPTSIRHGQPVRRGTADELEQVLGEWFAGHDEGMACVIATEDDVAARTGADRFAQTLGQQADRVRVLTPELSKGLEFDLVVVVRPDSFGDGITGAVDRYVAMTRATEVMAVLA